jgi:translation initiation factor IF-3
MTTCATKIFSNSSMFSSREIIVLDADGKLIGRMNFNAARDLANREGLDLIEINKQGDTSVYKIMDHGKWLYEQKKKLKDNKPQARQLKEMKFGMRIERHDEETKIRHIKEFLEKDFDVRIIVEMHGRERSHPGLADEKLNSILTELDGLMRAEVVRKSPTNVAVLIHAVKN